MLAAWISIFFANITWMMFGKIMSLALMFSILVALYRMHTNKNNTFDLTELFIDVDTRRVSGSKVRMNLAFFVTSWVLVYATLKGSITEWLFAGYIAAWVLDRKFSRESTASQSNIASDSSQIHAIDK